MMKNPRILILEDNPDDADLVQRELRKAEIPFTAEIVETRQGFLEALSRFAPDLILSDNSLPQMDGITALHLTKQANPGLPFIFVTGSMGEEAAIEMLTSGATDYVLKDRLSRLAPAVRRALQEAEEREERYRSEVALRASEEQLRHAQKMEAVGSLAGGVAHDFNNLLSIIIGYGEIFLQRLGHEDPLREMMGEIMAAADSAVSLTRQLLTFSRKEIIEPRVLVLNTLLTDLGKMIHRLVGEDIEFVTKLGENLGCIKADPGHIEQIIMNLVVNARDAMPRGGKLTLETANITLEDDGSSVGIPPGTYVMLAVSDTGIGMSREVQERIFEPFFTTKAATGGTGLGLSTVYGIVKQSSGHIEVESAPDAGTTFRIYLQRTAEPVEPPKEQEMHTPLRGTETVLVVEDEAGVRKMIAEILQGSGYSVLVAPDPRKAEEIFRRSNGAIQLLLTDIVLPIMTGRELADRLARLQEGLKVIYMSGYTDDAMVRHGVADRKLTVLSKPFTIGTLTLKVREALDAAPMIVTETPDDATHVMAESSLRTEGVLIDQDVRAIRILVIDDDQQVRSTVRDILEEKGYELVDAQDGRRGLQLVAEKPFDLIITDVFMPGQDGFETLRLLRSECPGTKIIVMSGGMTGSSFDPFPIASALGAARTLEKPFDPDSLLRAVDETLREVRTVDSKVP